MKTRKNHSRLLSLRSAIAISGAALVTLTLSQVADTQAAFTNTATANVSTLATGNYYPTPLTTSVTCTTSGGSNLIGRRANLSWPAVAGATGYLVQLVYSNGSVYDSWDVAAPTTSSTGISTTDPRASVYARVYTKNGPATSSGWTGANTAISFKDYASKRTECESGPSPSQANQSWENQSTWNPVSGASARVSIQPEGGGPLGGPDPSEATPTPSGTPLTTSPTTSAPVPTASPTTSQPAPTTSDVTAAPTATTATPATTTPTATTSSGTSQATITKTSAPSRPAASPIDLGDGLTAKLVDRGGVRTVLLLSDSTEQCSAEIPGADALGNGGNGTLTVTDGDGNVHYVNTANCSTS